MGLFPRSFIDDLRLQADIAAVVQEYVPLRRAGRTYKGLCPFHSEKTPSFHVDPDKGFFHCFGCGAGGDVFKFLELHEKVSFQEALSTIAQKFGVPLPEPVGGDAEDARRDAALRESLLTVHEVAAAYFREQLAGSAGARARRQLAERGLTPQAIEQLGLGYAPPGRDGLKSHLLRQGFTQGLLLKGGLVVERDSGPSTGAGPARAEPGAGEIVDRFRNRLMIPICRDAGSVIAFGGRHVDADQGGPKYLNSPETPIYSKSRTLYGLHLTKGAIRKAGFAVLVEGYFDFAQVFQSQAAPAVASCGTALTPQQARLLRRFTGKVVLSYDPDAAGEGAAARSCDLLVAEGFDVNVVVLDKGEDPDTFIRRHGAERYRERLRTSRPYLEYLLDQASAGIDFAHDDSRREFLGKMLGVAARIPDAAARDQFADRLAHKTRITEDVVRAEIRKAAAARRTMLPAGELPGFGAVRPAERGLIWGLFHRTAEAMALLAELEPADLETLAAREVFELARTLQAEPQELLPAELLRRLSTVQAQLVTGIAGESTAPATSLGDCARMLKRLRCERERAAVQREIDRLQGLGGRGEDIDLLLDQKRSLAQRIEALT